MTHRNTPNQETGISPSMLLFGHPIRDHLPRHDRELRKEWAAIDDAREFALAKRVLKTTPSSGKILEPLKVGESVQLQNQSGNKPNKWHNTGIVSECLPHRQYNVIVDGSRRVTLRNRRFLKPILPVTRRLSYTDSNEGLCTPEEMIDSSPMVSQPVPVTDELQISNVDDDVMDDAAPTAQGNGPYVDTVAARRSRRDPVQPDRFQARLSGKSHV